MNCQGSQIKTIKMGKLFFSGSKIIILLLGVMYPNWVIYTQRNLFGLWLDLTLIGILIDVKSIGKE